MSAHTHGNDVPTRHREVLAGVQPTDEATCPLKSTLKEPQSMQGDFQEDEDQLKKILIGVEEKSINPVDMDSLGSVKETGMVCLGKARDENLLV